MERVPQDFRIGGARATHQRLGSSLSQVQPDRPRKCFGVITGLLVQGDIVRAGKDLPMNQAIPESLQSPVQDCQLRGERSPPQTAGDAVWQAEGLGIPPARP